MLTLDREALSTKRIELDNIVAKASVNVVMARVLPQRVVHTASIWKSATESLQIHEEYTPQEAM